MKNYVEQIYSSFVAKETAVTKLEIMIGRSGVVVSASECGSEGHVFESHQLFDIFQR